jgi:ABC-type Fe3+ transport system permease subunit
VPVSCVPRGTWTIEALPPVYSGLNYLAMLREPECLQPIFAIALATSFGDFVTSIILYTYDTRPISMEVLGSLRQADVEQAAAFGVVLMALSAAVFFAAGEGRGATG